MSTDSTTQREGPVAPSTPELTNAASKSESETGEAQTQVADPDTDFLDEYAVASLCMHPLTAVEMQRR